MKIPPDGLTLLDGQWSRGVYYKLDIFTQTLYLKSCFIAGCKFARVCKTASNSLDNRLTLIKMTMVTLGLICDQLFGFKPKPEIKSLKTSNIVSTEKQKFRC